MLHAGKEQSFSNPDNSALSSIYFPIRKNLNQKIRKSKERRRKRLLVPVAPGLFLYLGVHRPYKNTRPT